MKISDSIMPVKFVVACFIFVVLGLAVIFIRSLSCAHQARFNVDVLERFIQLYNIEEGEYPEDLSKLRPIDVVSFGESLALNSKDLTDGEWRGYQYSYQRLAKDKFVLSASPVGFLPAQMEFGATEGGFVRANIESVDPAIDPVEEIKQWKPLRRSEGVVTRPR